MQYLATISLVLSLIPQLVQLVEVIEGLIPGGGQGAAKLTALRTMLEGLFKTSTQAQVAFETAWPIIQNVIGQIVEIKNRTGVFSTGPKVAAATPAK